MKNLLALLAFSLLTFISCQSEAKTPSSDSNTPKAIASVPTTTAIAAPASVTATPETAVTEIKNRTDEAPAVPAEVVTATKSVKNTVVKPKSTPTETIPTEKIKEVLTETKEDVKAKITAEKESLVAEAAKKAAIGKEKTAEMKEKAVTKATEIKEVANTKAETAKNTIKEKIGQVKEIKEEAAFSHQVFDDLLRKHVSSTGKVNYTGLKQDQAKLKTYLAQLEAQAVEGSWSKNKKLAYWINAYNAYTIDLIIRNYPLKSITDLEGGKPWDKKFIKLNGQTLSLNNIENDIIRPTFKDARIHFAVNCAAKSCPPLMNKAWTESNLQSELEKRTRTFINNSAYNTISSGSATISKIFEWYAVDFGNLNDYLAKYSEVNGATKISYNEYDWSLNN